MNDDQSFYIDFLIRQLLIYTIYYLLQFPSFIFTHLIKTYFQSTVHENVYFGDVCDDYSYESYLPLHFHFLSIPNNLHLSLSMGIRA